MPAEQSQDKSKKRNSSEALHEIQVNSTGVVKRVKAEPGESPPMLTSRQKGSLVTKEEMA